MPLRPSLHAHALMLRRLAVLLVAGSVLGADLAPAPSSSASNPTSGFRPLVKDDRRAEPLLAPASTEGELRIKQFQLNPGLQVRLWAAEPMLANPVAFSIDEKGRLFTSETYRYRTSVLDIRHYMFMLEDDLAARRIEDRLAQIRKWFGPEGEKALTGETEVIRLLEDRNQDGKADVSTLFADGFNSPLSGIASGVLARHGEVYLTEIPSLWKFRPANPEESKKLQDPSKSLSYTAPPSAKEAALHSLPHLPNRTHVTEELLRGFGVRFSFTGHDLHGLIFGPDGRLYFSCGDRGAHVLTREGTVVDLPDEGAVFRCEPDGSHLEVVHRGLRNPQELAFNDVGDLFTGDNDSDQGDRERWVQVIPGADSGWRVGHQHAPLGNAGLWNMERLWVPHFPGQAASILPPIANIGDGPSGLVYDTGTSLPESLRGRFLLAYFKGTSAKSGISSLQIRPAGAGYELVAHDAFVWNSLVPDVDLGPDGAIYFADWHEGWPKSNKGRIYRATFPQVMADPVVKETQNLLAEGMTQRKESELLRWLGHRDRRVRQEAHLELASRGIRSISGLEKVASTPGHSLARLHAIWALARISRTTQNAGVVKYLSSLDADPDAEVRVQVARTLGDAVKIPEAAISVSKLLNDSHPRVSAQAAWSLVSLATVHPNKEGVSKDLLRLASQTQAQERVRLDAYSSALAALASEKTLRQVGTQREPTTRMTALLALRKQAHPSIASFLSDPDPLLILEAARAIHDLPITNALTSLASLADPALLDARIPKFAALKKLPPPETPNGVLRDLRADQPLPWSNAPMDHLTPFLLRVVNANFRLGTTEAANRLASLAAREDLPELIRTEALFALANWAKPAPRDRLLGIYRPLSERDPQPARQALTLALPRLVVFQAPPPLTAKQQAQLEAAKSADPSFRAVDTRSTTQVPEKVLTTTAEALAQLRPQQATETLFHLVASSAPARSRAAALRALAVVVTENFTSKAQLHRKEGRYEYQGSSLNATEAEGFWRLGTALSLASQSPEEVLRLESSKLAVALNPGDAVGQIASKLNRGSIGEQQAAFASLGDLTSDAADALLAEWLDKLMKREVPNEVMLDLVEAAKKRSAIAVKSRLTAYSEWKLPKDALSPYRETLQGGDAVRGRKLFYEHPAVACTRCHQIGTDSGGNAGPRLDGLASRATREHLLESIVLPNQQIAPGFESTLVTTRQGSTYAGVIQRETEDSLLLLVPEEGAVTVAKKDIQTRERGVSGMPEGFGDLLTRFELRDLVEFLGTLR